MSKIVDARNLSCPHPVILTKKAMTEGESNELTTIVNQQVALENVTKLAKSQGYKYVVEEKDGDYYINMTRENDIVEKTKEGNRDTSVLIGGRCFGRGDEQLGEILMKSFLYTLTEISSEIRSVIFMNSGIFLTCEGSPVLDHIKALEDEGVEILSCGTCLDFYQMKDSLAVGTVTNMFTAIETLNSAPKRITV